MMLCNAHYADKVEATLLRLLLTSAVYFTCVLIHMYCMGVCKVPYKLSLISTVFKVENYPAGILL